MLPTAFAHFIAGFLVSGIIGGALPPCPKCNPSNPADAGSWSVWLPQGGPITTMDAMWIPGDADQGGGIKNGQCGGEGCGKDDCRWYGVFKMVFNPPVPSGYTVTDGHIEWRTGGAGGISVTGGGGMGAGATREWTSSATSAVKAQVNCNGQANSAYVDFKFTVQSQNGATGTYTRTLTLTCGACQ